MEKVDQEYEHVCKLCSKSFPCGRSLGGHMRSHVINDLQKIRKPKLKSINTFCFNRDPDYTLTKSPKPCKFSNAIDEDFDYSITANRKHELNNLSHNKFEVHKKNKKRCKPGRNGYKGNNVKFSIEQEQEEIAMCLIMLSRDLGCENREIFSMVESPDNKYELLEVGSTISTERNDLDDNHGDLSEKLNSGNWDMEMKKMIKFECSSCNKTFHSYQALGGHRASHNKIKGCLATKAENSKNKIHTLCKPLENNSGTFETERSCALKKKKKKKKENFECSICFKVFPSGQALGGHKRSHVVVSVGSKSNQTSIIHNQITRIKGFLDLNLPGSVEDEEEDESRGFKPWWVDSIG